MAADGAMRLLDFEYGGYRHALYDQTAWSVLCPLPERLVERLRRGYWLELAKRRPPALAEEPYRDAWAALCAYRALAILTWIPPAVLQDNRPWAEDWTMREAVLAAVSRLALAADGIPWLAPVSAAAVRLRAVLRARWPDLADPFPRWPAAQGGPGSDASG
jgi:hypothetical protein